MDAGVAHRPRLHVRNRYVLVGDLALVAVSVMGSFALRLDVSELPFYFPAVVIMLVVALLVKLPVYYFFGLYRRLWIYASTGELRLITTAVTAASVLTSGVMLVLISLGLVLPGMPRSALGIDWLLSLILIGGSRFALRVLSEQNISSPNGKTKNALIVGAGDAGALVVRELQKSSQLNLSPVGFLDDDQVKQDQEIYGVRVIGTLSDLDSVLEKQHVDEVIIAIPTAPGRVVRMITEVCRTHNIPSRTMPGIYELIGGKVNVSRLREVEISDLLRREPAKVDDALVGISLSGKRVLVTGAGGSIGREICRQVARWNPEELVILGHGENSIFETLLELQEDFPSLVVDPVIADIRDMPRIQKIFKVHHPDVVFHAAAHKHVPLMEFNPEEAITNNVIGTRNVVQVSIDSDVERFVLVSTDKAVKPINVYGATKRLAEMIVIDAAHRTNRIFTVVRFGNVLGSRGSVIPIFKSQIARGGPILVTHPEMERYFMIIPEAVHLVLQAAAMGLGGEAFILNMGEQVRILELAKDLIRLSGLEPERDIEIVFTGIRSGEKLSEDLWEQGANFEPTSHKEIFRSKEDEVINREQLTEAIDQLDRLAQNGDVEAITNLLDEIVPGASIRSTPTPDLISIV